MEAFYNDQIQKYADQTTLEPWQKELHLLGRQSFQTFPTTKWEDWKYTTLKPLLSQNYPLFSATSKNIDVTPYMVHGLPTLVFLNGQYSAELSTGLPENIHLLSLEHLNAQEQKLLTAQQEVFWSFGHALSGQGQLIEVTADHEKSDLHLLHITTEQAQQQMFHPLTVFRLNATAKLNLLESFRGESSAFRNQRTLFHLSERSQLERLCLQQEHAKTLSIFNTHTELKKGARSRSFHLNLGAKLHRDTVSVHLNEPKSHAGVHGLFALKEDQHCDNWSFINHQVERTESAQVYKGILDGSSRGVFNGKILVSPQAQQVNSSQVNKNLLLSAKAHVDTRPQLEIYADDVKCAHGATVGQLNEEQIFYLQSRGIPKAQARQRVIQAFAADALSQITYKPFRQLAQDHLQVRMQELTYAT